MTPQVVTVGENTPDMRLRTSCKVMVSSGVPGVKDGKVSSVVSRADLLRGPTRLGEDMPSASAEDRASVCSMPWRESRSQAGARSTSLCARDR